MPPRRFEEQYHCYSVAYADKSHLEVSFAVSGRNCHLIRHVVSLCLTLFLFRTTFVATPTERRQNSLATVSI